MSEVPLYSETENPPGGARPETTGADTRHLPDTVLYLDIELHRAIGSNVFPRRARPSLQGYLAHKKQPTPLGPP